MAAISAEGAIEATAFTINTSERECKRSFKIPTNLSNRRVIQREHDTVHQVRVPSSRRVKPDGPVPAEEEY